MAKYRSFAGPSRSVLIEVDEGGGGAGGNLPELLGVVADIAASCADAIARVPDKKRPGEVKVTFALRALEDGSLAIALDDVHANFTVAMTWSGGGAAQSPEVPTKPPEAPAG